MHPIISYVAEAWDRALLAGVTLDLNDLKLSEVFQACRDGAAANPSWSSQLYSTQLNLRLWTVSPDDYWWLPPLKQRAGAQGECTEIVIFLFHA